MAQTKRRLQYPIFLLPSTLVRTKEKVSLRKSRHMVCIYLPDLKEEGSQPQTDAEGGQEGRGELLID